jgi:hypothetical protein
MTIKNPKDKNFTNKFHLQSMTTHMNHKRKKGKKRQPQRHRMMSKILLYAKAPEKFFVVGLSKSKRKH